MLHSGLPKTLSLHILLHGGTFLTLDTTSGTLLATLYSAPLQPEQWNVFLADLCRSCDVSKAALIAHDFQDQKHRISVSFGEAVKDSVRDYETCYWQFDEWTLRFPKTILTGRIIQGVEIWPEESLRKSVFYNEFLKRFDTCEMAAVLAGKSRSRFEALSFYRGPREPQFGREQFAFLRAIAPHLQTALALRRRFLALESRVSDLETALDQLPTAFVLIDAEGKPLFANRAARLLCEQRDGLHLSTARLSVQIPTENARLREIISKAISAGSSKNKEYGGAALVSRADKRPLHVLAAPFISQNSAAPKGAVAVVFISDPDQKSALPTEVLSGLYGLTPAEARLALILLDGKPLTEIAEMVGVGHETVRSQIKSVMHKTGTRRQGELIRLLCCLPGQGA